MSDFPTAQDTSQTVISSLGKQSLGYYGFQPGTTAPSFPVANSAILVPFVIAIPTPIVKIFWENGATVSGNIDAGIYDSQGNRIVSAGSTVQTGTTAIQIVDTTDVILEQGVYYMALTADNTTSTFRASSSINPSYLRSMGMYSQITSFPLPSTITFTAPVSAFLPFLALTGSTII